MYLFIIAICSVVNCLILLRPGRGLKFNLGMVAVAVTFAFLSSLFYDYLIRVDLCQ